MGQQELSNTVWQDLNEKEQALLRNALRLHVEDKIKHCESWKDSGDKGMCYVYEVNPLRELFYKIGGKEEHINFNPYRRGNK